MSKARDLANAGTALTTVSATELGYLDGVTSAVQTQINAKQATVSGVNDTEIGYLDGVTSAIQTQINAQIPKSTVTTKGDILVATGSGTIVRQGVGTDGQVLVADSAQADGVNWATPSAGGMTLLSTTSLSGSGTVISSISQSYTNLFITMENTFLNSDSGFQILFRFNNDSNANRHYATPWNSSNTSFGFNNTTVTIADNLEGTSAPGFTQMTIYDYTGSHWKLMSGWGLTQHSNFPTNQGWYHSFNAGYNQSTAISSIAFYPSSGNFSGGTVKVYGVK
jgi:hypothetical protein